jgi:hypothetical protein
MLRTLSIVLAILSLGAVPAAPKEGEIRYVAMEGLTWTVGKLGEYRLPTCCEVRLAGVYGYPEFVVIQTPDMERGLSLAGDWSKVLSRSKDECFRRLAGMKVTLSAWDNKAASTARDGIPIPPGHLVKALGGPKPAKPAAPAPPRPTKGMAAIAADIVWHAEPLTSMERLWGVPKNDQTCPEPERCFKRESTLSCSSLRGVPDCANVLDACSNMVWITDQSADATALEVVVSPRVGLSLKRDLRELTFFMGENADGYRAAMMQCYRQKAKRPGMMAVADILPAR